MRKFDVDRVRALFASRKLISSADALYEELHSCNTFLPLAPLIADLVKCYDVLCEVYGVENELCSRIGSVGRSPKPPRCKRGK